jgi:hypothetical protein
MASIPPFILDPLFGAYTKGAAAVAAVRDAGGWGAVSALYTDPPESTEQLLHPREKLLGRRDHPVTFAPPPVDVPAFVPAIRELVPIDHDVVGELTMAVYFKNWGDTHPAAEVTGWGGDLYTVYTRGDAAIGFWLTAWDTEKDAKRFATAYAATLASRFPGSSPWTGKKGAHGVILPDGTVTGVVQPVGREREVYVVDGAPAGDASAYFAWMHHRVVTSHPER